MKYDILIINANTRKHGASQRIGIKDGKITAIGEDLEQDAAQIIDAEGNQNPLSTGICTYVKYLLWRWQGRGLLENTIQGVWAAL